jgi:hypothetical protein
MKLSLIGGMAAITCAVTYLIGFAFILTILAPLGFGTDDADPTTVVNFIAEKPGILITFNTIIYIINALALAVLVVALYHRLVHQTPQAASITRTLGTIWATLVLGAGMLANVSVERVHALAADPQAAAALWDIMRTIELGLGGGNEIAGGVWILSVSVAALSAHAFSRFTVWLGILTGFSGLATIVPALGEITGAIFGLGAIAWFINIGIELLRLPSPTT